MQRRSFLKSATAATLVASLPRPAFSAARDQMRIALGGISIECSTYSRIRARTEDFNVLTGDALASSARFGFLKKYPANFMPTVVASATPGGPVDRATYDAIKTDYDQISRAHFDRSYFQPEGMRFASSDALFPPADLAKAISAEYEAQCKLLCYGSYPSWREVQDRLLTLRDLL